MLDAYRPIINVNEQSSSLWSLEPLKQRSAEVMVADSKRALKKGSGKSQELSER